MKNFASWSLAVLITLTAVYYQRMTGPTNPKRVSFVTEQGEYKAKFERSLDTSVPFENDSDVKHSSNMEVRITPAPENASMYVDWRRYPGNDSLVRVVATSSSGLFSFSLPSQPPAGKIAYYPILVIDGKDYALDEEIILRYKAPVPALTLVPHILLMFVAMFFSNYVGIAALLKIKNASLIAVLTMITLFAGGLVLGPLVQKAAFGEYWTGWPFGGDLTDTKTLFAFLLWVAAWYFNRKKGRRYLYVLASVVMMLVYTIPHSTAGSEFDYERGIVVTGGD